VLILLVVIALLWPSHLDPAIWLKEWNNRERKK
jgi:hypothetical protein